MLSTSSAFEALPARTQAPMAERRLRSRLCAKGERAMSKGSGLSKAMQFRGHAAACCLFAANARSTADRELLLHMQRSLLERACREDGIDGLPPIPPGRAAALAVPRQSSPAGFVLNGMLRRLVDTAGRCKDLRHGYL
jgi:hypothetical protein